MSIAVSEFDCTPICLTEKLTRETDTGTQAPYLATEDGFAGLESRSRNDLRVTPGSAVGGDTTDQVFSQ
jgi:hypothetical protein